MRQRDREARIPQQQPPMYQERILRKRVDGEDVGHGSRQRYRRLPSPPAPTACPTVERRQLRCRLAEAPPVALIASAEEEAQKQKVQKGML
ncbi:hypothetical protein R1sor_008027 [Riccia sorocarpa]|uniref:Uncharacterized protein n=1 Tax=Riccia sorocarpa TaxID=122646 RepID=A0ABD3HWC6_9MARC